MCASSETPGWPRGPAVQWCHPHQGPQPPADLRVCLLGMGTLGSGPQVARSPSPHLTLHGLFRDCYLVSDEIFSSPAVSLVALSCPQSLCRWGYMARLMFLSLPWPSLHPSLSPLFSPSVKCGLALRILLFPLVMASRAFKHCFPCIPSVGLQLCRTPESQAVCAVLDVRWAWQTPHAPH